jgi:hypothetical protein
MMPLARKRRKMSKIDAQAWVYAELDRLHPPQKADIVLSDEDVQNRTLSGPKDDGQFQGRASIPDDWPELPANAALATASDDGDHGVMRRERVAIEEMEELLAEMLEAEEEDNVRSARN